MCESVFYTTALTAKKVLSNILIFDTLIGLKKESECSFN